LSNAHKTTPQLNGQIPDTGQQIGRSTSMSCAPLVEVYLPSTWNTPWVKPRAFTAATESATSSFCCCSGRMLGQLLPVSLKYGSNVGLHVQKHLLRLFSELILQFFNSSKLKVHSFPELFRCLGCRNTCRPSRTERHFFLFIFLSFLPPFFIKKNK
jgi:hypothetical protein